MHKNLERYDLSNWLIHFTRPINTLHKDSPAELENAFGWADLVEDTKLSPFFLLRRILRQRQIVSTWSIRGGRRTVYGSRPAVCFTEMPLAAFLDASRVRSKRGEKISEYAVILRKDEAFQAGARPVIYGLSNPSARDTTSPDGTRRFPESALPDAEQYRHVAFNPAAGGRLDWSHEREWRWPNAQVQRSDPHEAPDEGTPQHEEWREENEARQNDRVDNDGLCLDTGEFSQIGFLVKNNHQAKLLTHDILRLADTGIVPHTLFSFILRLDALPHRDQLLDPTAVTQAISAATVHLGPFFTIDKNSSRTLRSKFDKIAETVGNDPRRYAEERGGCWLWLTDNTHPLTRALLLAPAGNQRIDISRSGRYLVRLPELGDDRALQLRQELTSKIAAWIANEFGAPATYYSVLNSDDPDGIPFYAGAFDDVHVNRADDKGDF